MFLNVLLPEIVNAPAPPWSNVMPEYDRPPPANVLADALFKLIVPVPVIVGVGFVPILQGLV